MSDYLRKWGELLVCVCVCVCVQKRDTERERRTERGKKEKGRVRKRQGRNLGFQYPGGTLPVGQWDHER